MVVGDVTTAVDVLVLGGGPGGYVSAIRAAQLGRRVTLVEPGPIGGTCLNRACIPLKALISASERYQQAQPEELAAMGIHTERVTFNWPDMQAWKHKVSARLSGGIHRLLSGNRIELVKGVGWFLNEQEVRVEGEETAHRFKFEHCILAVGSVAAPSAQLPYDGQQVLTPEQALALQELPEKLSIFGDDYIALEMATIFARLGVKVSLYSPEEQILPDVEPMALRLVQAGLRKLGIEIKTHTHVTDITERPLVLSIGMKPNVSDLHLDAAGVQLNERGGIAVNTMMQSNVERIYAVGDCIGEHALAVTAIKQGKVAAEALYGQRVQFAPLVLPQAVYTAPELATVGYSAQAATHAGYTITTGRFPLAANGRASTLGADNGVAFIVANAEDGLLLGATVVGPYAGEIIEQVTLAIEMGATLTDISEVLYPHPSVSEMLQESAESALNRAIHILM